MQSAGYEMQAKLVEQKGLPALIELASGFANPPAMAQDFRFDPAISEELLPTVFRGAALSQFPDREQVAQIRQPVLILAWVGDPGHPLSTSEELLALLPDAELRVAQSPEDVAGWVAAADEFLSRV